MINNRISGGPVHQHEVQSDDGRQPPGGNASTSGGSPRVRSGGTPPPSLNGLRPPPRRGNPTPPLLARQPSPPPTRNTNAADDDSDDEFFDALSELPVEPAAAHTAPAAPAGGRRPTVADVAHDMRHPSSMMESTQTSSFFFRSRVKPLPGMQLPISGRTLDKAPAAVRSDPAPPAAAVKLKKSFFGGAHKKMLKAMRTTTTQIAPELPKPAKTDQAAPAMAALNDEAAMTGHITALFVAPEPPTPQHAAALRDVMGQLAAALPAPARPGHAAATSFQYTHRLLVGEHLAGACGGQPQRAAAALAVLTSAPRMNAMLRTLGNGALSGAPLDALRTASKLAATASGFEALMAMMQPPLDTSRQAGFQRLLTAAGKVGAEGAGRTGAAALAHCGRASATRVGRDAAQRAALGGPSLADEVLHIELRLHNAMPAEGPAPAAPYAALSAAERTSVFSWAQGFRDSGPGTELSMVQGRLAKMAKYVERAGKHERLHAARPDLAHPFSSANGRFVKARAKLALAGLRQVVGKKKSPMDAFRKLGVNNAGQGHPDDNINLLDDSVDIAMRELGTHLSGRLPAAGRQHAAIVDGLGRPDTPLPRVIERAGLLAYLRQSMNETRPLGHELDHAALVKTAILIAEQHGVPEARMAITDKLKGWLGKSVTLQHLQKWADDDGLEQRLPSTAGAGAAGPAPTQLQETPFGTALRVAANIVDPRTNLPTDLTADGVHRYVRTYIQEASWGNPVTATSGGTVGVNLAPLSIAINKFKKLAWSGTGVLPVVDLRATRTHNAVLNFGTSHHGGELFLGTQKQYAGSLGGGVAATIRKSVLPWLSFQLGGNAVVSPLAGDGAFTRGVMVRTARVESKDGMSFASGESRAELVRFVDTMFGIAKGERGGTLGPRQAWETIANDFFDSKTLSIGWQNQTAETLRHTASGAVNARAGVIAKKSPFEALGVGGTVGASVDWASLANNKRTETTGDKRMIRSNYFSRTQVNANVGAALVMPAIPVHEGGHTTESLNVVTPLYGKQANFSLIDQGANVTFRAIVDKGRLSDTYTLREVEHRDAGHFKQLLTEPSRRAQFERVFEAAHGAGEGPRELDKFIRKLDTWAGPGQHYTMRSRLRADLRKGLDESAALATAIHARDPSDPQLARLSAHMMSVLTHEDSWVPMQVQSYEAQNASDVGGLNFGAVLTSNHGMATDRELFATAAPPNVVRRWADQPAPSGPAPLPPAPPTRRR